MKNTDIQKNRTPWINNLRFLALFGVMLVHASFSLLYNKYDIDYNTWQIGNFYDSIARFCVPIFFMLSGATLLSKDYDLTDFLKKRFKRIIPPLIFWSLVYIAYDLIFTLNSPFSIKVIGKKVLYAFVHGSRFHMWFIYVLIGLYLLIPILRRWIKHATKKEIHYFLLIWLLTIVYQFPHFDQYLPDITLIHFSGYVGYMVLGYYLCQRSLPSRVLSILFILVGTSVTFFGTIYLSAQDNHFNEFFYGYLSPNVLLSSAGLFLLFRTLSIRNSRLQALSSFVNNHSYGIYLVHILILELLHYVGINWQFIHPAIGIPVAALSCLVLSIVSIYVLTKIKFGHYISG